MEIKEKKLAEYYNFALKVARNAGEIIKCDFDEEKSVDTKLSYADLVTKTDKAVEEMVFSTVKEAYPAHKLIGEESSSGDSVSHVELTDAPTWIVDPVDGTTNFVHNVLEVCLSIGLVIDKQPVVGVVYLPVRDIMYSACHGSGAFKNGRRLQVTKKTDLPNALVLCEVGSSRDEKIVHTKMANMEAISMASHGIRNYGSAAYNLCCIAQSSGDAYVEYGIHIWDFVAGMLIAKEAGAVVLDPEGRELDLLARRILVASSLELALQISAKLIHIDSGRD